MPGFSPNNTLVEAVEVQKCVTARPSYWTSVQLELMFK